jgi:hypothetical protein
MNRDEAYKQLNEEIKGKVAKLELKSLSMLKRKLAHLDMELEVRKNLSFKKVEPTFEYENEPLYLAHLKKGLELTVEEMKLDVQQTINTIENNKRERDLLEQVEEAHL